MFPPALVLFLLGAAGGLWLAWSRGRRAAGGFIAATHAALAAYEFSFSLVPVREWIRVDLLITLPFALACLTATGVIAVRARQHPRRF